jgi:hypothetical protein
LTPQTASRNNSAAIHYAQARDDSLAVGDPAGCSGGCQYQPILVNGFRRFQAGALPAESGAGLEISVKDHYEHFAGTVRWLLDKEGVGKVSYDYTYSGPDLDSREIGLQALLRPDYDEVRWQRWSEWGVFPKDSISRTEGSARAHRDQKWPAQPANVRPSWPWSQDETELGTADFRAIKFNIYHASLVARDGSGVGVDANADVHFRACLATNGVKMHLLSQCPLAPVVLKDGAHLAGDYNVRLMANSP